MNVLRDSQVALFVIGRMDLLLADGLIGGWKTQLTPQGVHVFDQLEASGFKPTQTEVRACLAALTKRSPGDIEQDAVTLVLHYRSPETTGDAT